MLRFGLSALLAIQFGGALAYECVTEGCTTSLAPVCGKDGVSYGNDCIATCQGVVVASAGPCSSTVAAAWEAQNSVVTVTLASMQQFAADGFKFQRAITVAPPAETDVYVGAKRTPLVLNGGAATGDDTDTSAVRLAGGLVFVQPSAAAGRRLRDAEDAELNYPASLGDMTLLDEDEDRRRLDTFGADDRFQVTKTKPAPFRAVGELWFTDDGGLYTCSASVISKDSILTAGHCVVEFGSFAGNFKFFPAQVSATYGRSEVPPGYFVNSSNPFGEWNDYISVTTFQRWIDASSPDGIGYKIQSFMSDMAVIKFGPGGHKNKLIGDVTGYLGLSSACPVPPVTTTGYPGDKPQGTMWTQPTFEVIAPCGGQGYKTDADAYFGQSGSPVYDPVTNYIYGIFSYAFGYPDPVPESSFPDKIWGGGPRMTKKKLKSISAWAGL